MLHIRCEVVKILCIMSENKSDGLNATDGINATFSEIKESSLPEENVEGLIFLSDPASLVGIFVAVAVILLTIGKRTYGLASLRLLTEVSDRLFSGKCRNQWCKQDLLKH